MGKKLQGHQPEIYAADTYSMKDGAGAQSSNEHRGAPIHQNVLELLEFIDDFVKPEPRQNYEARFGIYKEDWDEIFKAVNHAIDEVIKKSIDLMMPVLVKASKTWELGFEVILTGRWSRNPLFKESIMDRIKRDFRNTKVLEDHEGEM
jgi:hypothetical protein